MCLLVTWEFNSAEFTSTITNTLAATAGPAKKKMYRIQ